MTIKLFNNHRICERCWFDGPGRIDADHVRMPVQIILSPPKIGTCCFCMQPVVTQIYVRAKADQTVCPPDYHDDDPEPAPESETPQEATDDQQRG